MKTPEKPFSMVNMAVYCLVRKLTMTTLRLIMGEIRLHEKF